MSLCPSGIVIVGHILPSECNRQLPAYGRWCAEWHGNISTSTACHSGPGSAERTSRQHLAALAAASFFVAMKKDQHMRSDCRAAALTARRSSQRGKSIRLAARTAEAQVRNCLHSTALDGACRGLHRTSRLLQAKQLSTNDGFQLHYEEFGNPSGIPAVFLHGGPGAGCTQRMAQLFDPERYHIVLFDQRGCGRSKLRDQGAKEQLEANTTWDLVEDIERLRRHLNFDKWVIGGGSWGTCLALAYASRHQDRILGMVLRAVCMFRHEELEYFCSPTGSNASSFPAAWQSFAGWLPWAQDASSRTIAMAFRCAALGEDASLSPSDAVRKWSNWENHLFAAKASSQQTRASTPATRKRMNASERLPSARRPTRPWPALSTNSMQALLTIHYVAERAFFPPGFELLDAASGFHFPLKLIHGRNDKICPVANAESLARAAPPGMAELLLTDAGHSQWDSANINAFVRATDALAAKQFLTV